MFFHLRSFLIYISVCFTNQNVIFPSHIKCFFVHWISNESHGVLSKSATIQLSPNTLKCFSLCVTCNCLFISHWFSLLFPGKLWGCRVWAVSYVPSWSSYILHYYNSLFSMCLELFLQCNLNILMSLFSDEQSVNDS